MFDLQLLIHICTLVIVVALSHFYIQLYLNHEELKHLCDAVSKLPKATAYHHQLLSTASSNIHSNYNSLEHLQEQTSGQQISKTTELIKTAPTLSVSQSFFYTSAVASTESLLVDQFGKTDGLFEEQTGATFSTGHLQTTEVTHVDSSETHSLVSQADVDDNKYVSVKQPLLQSSTYINRPIKKIDNIERNDLQVDDGSTQAQILQTDAPFSKTRFDFSKVQIPETSEIIKSAMDMSMSVRDYEYYVTHVNDEMKTEEIILSTEEPLYEKENRRKVQSCQNVKCEVLDDVENEENIEPMHLYELPSNGVNNEYNVHEIPSDPIGVRILNKNLDKKVYDSLSSQGTSSWCKTDGTSTKSCQFHNLCYKTAEKDFIFFRSNTSQLEFDPDLQNPEDWFTINLSTVPGHNAHMLSLVTIPTESLSKFSVAWLDGTSIIMSRFKPDNIMHVLHDDILPLFHTLRTLNLLGDSSSDVRLIFTDSLTSTEFLPLYLSLSSVPPLFLHHLKSNVDVLCFKTAHLGLSQSTLWYQYGFFKPQGPLPINGSKLMHKVRQATSYLAEHFHSECVFCSENNFLVLLSRKDNRLILNEGEFIMGLVRSTKLKVMSVSLETHSLNDIISIVRNSRGIIGMHGSLLSLSIFLKPGSVVVELFPYAVNPEKYTPFKTFCDIPSSGIIYTSWTNPFKQKSFPHPDWSGDLGGIRHLPEDVQAKIREETQVADHLCCNDPSWLYHIYQDTEVDVSTVATLTAQALARTDAVRLKSVTSNPPMMPGPVRFLSCTEETLDNKAKYILRWKLPWNLEFIPYKLLDQELVFQEKGTNKTSSITLKSDIQTYALNKGILNEYDVWIKVIVDVNVYGPYVYVACKINPF
ncbi:protein O-linked-mannose beta-1,4-N-acetylglucosaminyltransferase 2-like [Physella acuta]|uniref:protein O-linked-mannose beta-1,4-N-acetylglucosaminyltransferase 2-like n=1 Tax=Physella acuta TaxID=109671 RepID=UPI0027DD6F0B|nr:protein O-linked-mannose beta-1,4-N-acetylglucosaminyltransferase 2-like [Physella acuta]XP_059156051.1 protein O-linked-mannose beta-1,4-N-acetylglucosaminyltransferase 2-like [Physella acuta]XP_059156052.1 protein O-linked-mannose beta-1,4-N-acetylglucosaminyltransferase 2-like [Physella acuta]